MLIRKIINRIHTAVLRPRFASCGRGLVINYPSLFERPEKMVLGSEVFFDVHNRVVCSPEPGSGPCLFIGSRVSLGRFGHINAYGEVRIEEDVLIAERVHISDCSHDYENSRLPIREQGASFRGRVLICRGAWVGSGAVVLPGVRIGQNAVVGANAVVTRDVPDRHVAVGVPAKSTPIKQLEQS